MSDIVMDVVALIHSSKTTTHTTSPRTSRDKVQLQRDDDVSAFTAIERESHEAKMHFEDKPLIAQVELFVESRHDPLN